MAFSYRNYSESDDVKKYRENLANHEKNKVGEWTGGTYADSLKQAVDKINNREKFSYDLNNDMLYQQYKQQYINQGRLAMTDTVGQASALTGGYGNSYAVNAGNQAYQGYLQKLNGVVPELYQLALDKYNAEGSDLYNKASLYGSMYDKEYGEYRDKVSDWNAEYSRLSDKYNNERTYDYGQYSDAYNRAFGQYQQKVSEDQFAKNLALEYAQLAASRKAASSGSRGSVYTETEMSKAAKSEKVTLFKGSILTNREFLRRKKTVGKKRYDAYSQYINDSLADWYKKGTLTESEVAYLKGYYGL